MRSFRNSLIRRLLTLAGALALGIGVASAALTREPRPAAGPAPYFPLAVGNYWTYRCSVEGEQQFTKTVRLVSASARDNVQYFRAELRIKKDKPLVYYLFTDVEGHVFSVPNPGRGGSELLITAAPKAGEHVGTWTVAGGERIDTPALKQVDAVRIENFDRDDPQITAERRLEWRGRYYARDVGLLVEADGLGGECVLTQYHVRTR
jgi:hypothetical protein